MEMQYRNVDFLFTDELFIFTHIVSTIAVMNVANARATFPETPFPRSYLLQLPAQPPRLPNALELIHLSMYPASPLSLLTLARSIAPSLIQESLFIVSSCLGVSLGALSCL